MSIQARLLIAILVAAALFGTGTYVGYQYADGRSAKAAAEAQDAALEDARRAAEADKQEAIARVRLEALAEARARSTYSRGVTDAHLKARADCGRDDESFGLLRDAVDAANGAPAGAGSVPEKMPGITSPKRWFGQNH